MNEDITILSEGVVANAQHQVLKQMERLKNAVLNGEADALQSMVFAKALETGLKDLKQSINDHAVDEAVKYNQQTFDKFGATITVKGAPGKYSYDHIPEIVKAESDLKALKDKSKDALKAKQSGNIISSEDGEVIAPAEYTPGKQTVSIKLNN